VIRCTELSLNGGVARTQLKDLVWIVAGKHIIPYKITVNRIQKSAELTTRPKK